MSSALPTNSTSIATSNNRNVSSSGISSTSSNNSLDPLCCNDCLVNCDDHGSVCLDNNSIAPSAFDVDWCQQFGIFPLNALDTDPEPLFSGFDPDTNSFCYSLEAANFSSWATSHPPSASIWQPTYMSPCCDTRSCDLNFGNAQVFYFPTPAPVPNIFTILGPEGFAYTSPSVYVEYHNVYATDDCGTIGSVYSTIILSYSPGELSTFGKYGIENGPLNPTDLNNCTASTLTTRPAGDYDEPCIPELLYPEKLVEKGDPAWGLCGGPEIYLNGGAYDPPRVLTPTDALVLSPTKKPGAMPAFPAGPSLAPSTSPLSTPPPLTSTDPAGQADPGSHDKDPSNRGGDPKVPGSSKSPGPQNQVAGPSRNPKSGPITASGISGTYSTPSVQDPSSQGPNKGPKEDPKQDPNQSSGSQASNNQEQNPQRPDNGYGISSQTKGDSAGSKSHESGGNQGPTESSDANEPSPEANSQGDSKEPFDPASPAVGPLPTITYAGSAITPGPSSKYSLPGIGLLSPGGPDLTTNDLVYSLAPSATAILKNGQAVHLAPQPNQTAILTFASSIYTPNDVSHFVIGGQTVTPGGIITPKGTSISLNPSGRIAFSGPISSQQTLVTPVPAPPIARITFGSSTFTANPFGDFFIAGQMLSQGGLITVSGTPISLPPDGTSAIVGSVTQLLYPTPTLEPPFITFNGATYTADLAGNFLINGQTLNPGSAITASGTPISLSPDGTVAVIRSNSQILTTAPHATGKPILTFDGITYTANNADSFIIDGQTLRPGSAITVSGTPIPLPPGATVAIIGTSSQVLDPSLYTPALPIVTLQGSTYTANSSSAFHIDGQTLSKSGEITIQGTTLSYNVDGSNVVIGTSTQTLSTATPSNGDTITFAGQTYVANAAGAFVIAGQTLTPGGVVTVSGTPISFAANGTDVVIGTSTEAVGLGSFIMGGFGPAQTAPAVFEGRAAKRNLEGMMGVGCAVGILVACWI